MFSKHFEQPCKYRLNSTAMSSSDEENCEPHGRLSSKKRENLPQATRDGLKQWMRDNVHNPYPTEEQKSILADKYGIPKTRVHNWFTNARRRDWPNIKREMGLSPDTPEKAKKFKKKKSRLSGINSENEIKRRRNMSSPKTKSMSKMSSPKTKSMSDVSSINAKPRPLSRIRLTSASTDSSDNDLKPSKSASNSSVGDTSNDVGAGPSAAILDFTPPDTDSEYKVNLQSLPKISIYKCPAQPGVPLSERIQHIVTDPDKPAEEIRATLFDDMYNLEMLLFAAHVHDRYCE